MVRSLVLSARASCFFVSSASSSNSGTYRLPMATSGAFWRRLSRSDWQMGLISLGLAALDRIWPGCESAVPTQVPRRRVRTPRGVAHEERNPPWTPPTLPGPTGRLPP